MTRYQCRICNYKFEPKSQKNVKPKKCPYCGKDGTIIEEQKAQHLLDEASEYVDNFN